MRQKGLCKCDYVTDFELGRLFWTTWWAQTNCKGPLQDRGIELGLERESMWQQKHRVWLRDAWLWAEECRWPLWCCSVTQSWPVPWDLWASPCQASLSFTVSWSLLTHVHWVNDTIQTSRPLSPPSPPALNLSQYQGLFQWVGSLKKLAKDWNFSFSISPSNEKAR